MFELSLNELPVEAVIAMAMTNERSYYSNDGELICVSHDGIEPETVLAPDCTPQAKKCAVCVHNQWGSSITPNGKRGKACTNYGTLWLLAGGKLATLFLLRVPATSLTAFKNYVKALVARDLKPDDVVTKIETIQSGSYPQLTFRHIRILEDGELDAMEKSEKKSRVESLFHATYGFTH